MVGRFYYLLLDEERYFTHLESVETHIFTVCVHCCIAYYGNYS